VKSGRAVKLEPPSVTPSGLPSKPKSEKDGVSPAKVPKLEDQDPSEEKKPMPYGADSTFTGPQLFSVRGTSDQPKVWITTILDPYISQFMIIDH
jgi:hypothetical protein